MTQSPITSSHRELKSSPRASAQLVLMRHAKSDWSEGDTSDHDRSLNDRGLHDALKMARWIEASGLLPERILCSSAARTQQTADRMQSYWKNVRRVPGNLQIVPELYLAPAETILEIVRELAGKSPDPFTVLVLAHNPGISHAASDLLGRAIGLSTAAVVALRCNISDWSTPLTVGNTDLVVEMKPKSLDRDERCES